MGEGVLPRLVDLFWVACIVALAAVVLAAQGEFSDPPPLCSIPDQVHHGDDCHCQWCDVGVTLETSPAPSSASEPQRTGSSSQ